MSLSFNYLITLLSNRDWYLVEIFPGSASAAHFQETGGDNVARTEEGGEEDPGDAGGQEEEGGETEGLLREN